MEQNLEDMKKVLEKEKSENAKLQEDRQNLFKTYEAVEQQLNLLRQKNDKTIEKDNEFTQKYHQLEIDYRELQQNFNEINDILEQEKNEREDLIASNNDLEQYCAEIQQQKNDLEKKYGELQSEFLLCSQEVKKNKSELHNSLEMQKEVENIKNQEIDFCHKQIENLQKVVELYIVISTRKYINILTTFYYDIYNFCFYNINIPYQYINVNNIILNRNYLNQKKKLIL